MLIVQGKVAPKYLLHKIQTAVAVLTFPKVLAVSGSLVPAEQRCVLARGREGANHSAQLLDETASGEHCTVLL